jgi:hypothetical protein
MPAQLNWLPNHAAQNEYDVNGSLDIEGKVRQVWDAGYRCAAVPSDLIDNGTLKLDAQNRPTLNGHVFRAMIYLYPQYSKPTTLNFLDRYTQAGGSLMTEGAATYDFLGANARKQWATIAARAAANHFDVNEIAKLGIPKDSLSPSGSMLEDGSALLSDLTSITTKEPRNFRLALAGHIYTGSFVGMVALKVDASGQVEKFACGQCSGLQRDGKMVLWLKEPRDFVLHSDTSGYHVLMQGAGTSHDVIVTP